MQIIERSVVGTRSAVVRFTRRDSRLQFVVFPMIHVADPEFYAEVARRLARCDLLVVEGVKGRSLVVSAVTLTYRIIPANRRSGVVVQDIPYASLGVPYFCPDMTAKEFARGWRAMPLRFRLVIWCLLPFMIVVRFAGGRRRMLSSTVQLADFPSADEEERADVEVVEHLERTFRTGRDERVLAALAEIHRTRSGERIDVAVVYGAGHVRGIARGLSERLGYLPRSGEWLTVLRA